MRRPLRLLSSFVDGEGYIAAAVMSVSVQSGGKCATNLVLIGGHLSFPTRRRSVATAASQRSKDA